MCCFGVTLVPYVISVWKSDFNLSLDIDWTKKHSHPKNMSLQCVFHNIVVCALFVLQVLLVSHLFQSSICLGFVWERGKELNFTEKKKKKGFTEHFVWRIRTGGLFPRAPLLPRIDFLTILTVIMTICALLLLKNTALFMFPSFSPNLIYFPWLVPQVVHSADLNVIQTDPTPLHL